VFEINLAPWRKYQRQRTARLFLLWLIMGWLVVWALTAIGSLYLQQTVKQQSSQRVRLEERMATHQHAIDGLAAEVQSKSKILERAAELEMLLNSRFRGHQILLVLAHSAPANARYVEVDFGSGGLTVVGIAASNQAVAQLIDAVSESYLALPMQLMSAESTKDKGYAGGVSSGSLAPSVPSVSSEYSKFENAVTPVRFQIYGEAAAPKNDGLEKAI